ncbi:hypothetical protein [Natronorubrum bangense]|uniref:Uncharacterized protein n=2 Tax=Natronorubrum bangense TaxID=61858 RepID=L9WKW3_9EURY|nr:hypothetical protein [Natronorubrum bangense]ELY49997.1 hypothetical protein C494_06435 [Natronorubrum bangense JCM 10635]QCC54153.1 hypothetical protein DV706_06420 [Natronorubrum bangense]
MDHATWFLAAITFLLAAVVFEMGDGNTPTVIVVPVLIFLYGIPVYLVGAIVTEFVKAGSDSNN